MSIFVILGILLVLVIPVGIGIWWGTRKSLYSPPSFTPSSKAIPTPALKTKQKTGRPSGDSGYPLGPVTVSSSPDTDFSPTGSVEGHGGGFGGGGASGDFGGSDGGDCGGDGGGGGDCGGGGGD